MTTLTTQVRQATVLSLSEQLRLGVVSVREDLAVVAFMGNTTDGQLISQTVELPVGRTVVVDCASVTPVQVLRSPGERSRIEVSVEVRTPRSNLS